MAVTKFGFRIDKPFLSCYNLTVTGDVLMSKKNEIVANNSDFYAPSRSINDLYSELSSANNHTLDTYKDIIESPNVSEDIKKRLCGNL
jgi:capsular polysaccharide biosynthesis protein